MNVQTNTQDIASKGKLLNSKSSQNKKYWVLKVYPIVVAMMAIGLNFLFGIDSIQIATPSKDLITLISLSAIILVINHSWIMTVTELTRNKYEIYASPEEWIAKGLKRSDTTEKGLFEIDRCLNTHRNTTENIVYYILLVFIFAFASPNVFAAWAWILVFPISRLGYSYCYFKGQDNIRGIFMTLSLLSIYGMASYLGFSLLLH